MDKLMTILLSAFFGIMIGLTWGYNQGDAPCNFDFGKKEHEQLAVLKTQSEEAWTVLMMGHLGVAIIEEKEGTDGAKEKEEE